jgi:AmmeMemoRadiSam system protein A
MPALERIGPSLPAVARRAIELYLHGEGNPLDEAPGTSVPRAPVFVTLRASDGALRGCVGSLAASQSDVVNETARSAVLAATRDPRFPPVSSPELQALSIEVSVLGPEESVAGPADLDPRRYGVIVRDGAGRQGLLLPDIPGIDDASAQVEIARRKAGIEPGAALRLSRFEVRKWDDSGSDR